jgi:ABC-type polysaccharide/polyol phosphate export permease
MTLLGQLRELIQRRSVIAVFYSSELKSTHRDKLLGNLWHLIDPLSFMMVYYVVWSIITRRRQSDFMAYMFVGIVCFEFFQGAVIRSSQILRSQIGLIRGIYFPKSALPAAVVFSQFYGFACAVLALGGLMTFFMIAQSHLTPAQLAQHPHPLSVGINLLWFPAIAGIEVVFCLGCAYLFAILGAYFSDTGNVLNFVLRLLFYMSPLFYYPENVPKRFLLFYNLNPFSYFFAYLRGALIYNTGPDASGLLYLVALALITFVVGFAVFARYEMRVVKQL